MARNSKLTKLEQRSISTASSGQYYQFLEKLDFFKESDATERIDSREAVQCLADFIDVIFLEGRDAHEGKKTLAAVEIDNIIRKDRFARSGRQERDAGRQLLATSPSLGNGHRHEIICPRDPEYGLDDIAYLPPEPSSRKAIDLGKQHMSAPIVMIRNQCT